jgi:hypothetical protein
VNTLLWLIIFLLIAPYPLHVRPLLGWSGDSSPT